MGVDVDEPGRDDQSVGVDLAPARSVDPAHLGDDAVGDGQVGRAGRRTRAVDHGAAADHEVVHGIPPDVGMSTGWHRRTVGAIEVDKR